MCNCLPCCCPPAQQVGTFAATKMPGVLNEYEARGIDDFFKNICVELGCRDRQAAGKPTLLGITHKGVLKAAKQVFPDAAEDCLADSISGIVNAVGEACVEFGNDPAFLNKLLTGVAPHLGKLLSCIFGAERAAQIQLAMFQQGTIQAINLASCLVPLLTTLLQGACNGAMGGNLLAGCCPTNGGDNNVGGDGTDIFGKDAPPHDPPVDRGGSDSQTESKEASM